MIHSQQRYAEALNSLPSLYSSWKEKHILMLHASILSGLDALQLSSVNNGDGNIALEVKKHIDDMRQKLTLIRGANSLKRLETIQRIVMDAKRMASTSSMGCACGKLQMLSIAGMSLNVNRATLVMEMIMNPGFAIGHVSSGNIVNVVFPDTFKSNYFKLLKEELEKKPAIAHKILEILAYINSVYSYAISNASSRARVRLARKQIPPTIDSCSETALVEPIDIGLVKQKLDNNAFELIDLDKLVHGIASGLGGIMKVLGLQALLDDMSPKWEELDKRLQSSLFFGANTTSNGSEFQLSSTEAEILAEAFEFLTGCAGSLRQSIANLGLASFASVVSEKGTSYIQQWFNNEQKNRSFTFDGCTKWLSHTLARELAQAGGINDRISLEKLERGDSNAFQAVINQAVVDIVTEYPAWGGMSLGRGTDPRTPHMPETLGIHSLHIPSFKAHFDADVQLVTILNIALHEIKALIKEDGIRRSQLVRQVVRNAVGNRNRNTSPCKIVESISDALHGSIPENDINIVRTMMSRSCNKDHPVHKFMVR
jgi:hypothetical protein